jgi:transposase
MSVYIGIDWSEKKHDVLFMNPAGATLAKLVIAHTPDGFAQFDQQCRRLGFQPAECQIALETAHNLLIDFLWSHEYQQVYVVPPSQVRANRGRYSASQARDDPRDALLLADILRTDRSRLQPWHPDGLLVRQLRAKISLHRHLLGQERRLANRLRAILLCYYPAAVTVFSELTAQIALQFVRSYPTPAAAQALSYADFARFAQTHSYSHPKKLPACYARLQAKQPTPAPETVLVYQAEAVQLAELLLPAGEAKRANLREVVKLFAQHPDAAIFTSLPGTGDYLAPGLLAKFGEDRQRFPNAASVQTLAGTCPVTDQSGKHRAVYFRTGCDHEFRHIAQQWALASRDESAWAASYWQEIRPHCQSDSHATRCLANRWLAVAWKLWHSHQTYDEAYHMQQRLARRQPRA